MSRRFFIALMLLLPAVCSLVLWRQHRAIGEIRAERSARFTRENTTETPPSPPPLAATPVPQPRPSSELLRLRDEVGRLRDELQKPDRAADLQKQAQVEDWSAVHSGNRPSQHSDFLYFTNASKAGFATPDAAFQSFHYMMRHQSEEPLTDTRMKEIWDVPGDFDDPNSRYSIDLGEGIGGEIGYRIVGREQMAPNQIRLTIDFERRDGSSFRREKILVENGGRWRIRPAALSRQP
jgi:HAMP domain-containing protein